LAFGTLVSLAIYFIVMLGIGFYAYKKSTSDVSGYMLGGRSLSPSVAALSAGASDMSGWMLMGLPGAMYISGMSSLWIAIGLVMGAFLNYLIVAPRLRTYTEVANDSITLPDFFENRFNDKSRMLRIVSSVVIVALVAIYLAYDRDSSILSLVSNAWAGFGAAFGPVVIGSLYWKKMTRNGALSGMITGAVTVLFWIYVPISIDGQSLSSLMYEIVPGFILCSLVIYVVSNMSPQNDVAVLAKHDEMLTHHDYL
jgi:Na+/proline symporter